MLLDLHWSDAGEWGRHIGQHKMPDENTVAFWSDAAARYKNDPAVLFDLYNEPHDVPWEVWQAEQGVLSVTMWELCIGKGELVERMLVRSWQR